MQTVIVRAVTLQLRHGTFFSLRSGRFHAAASGQGVAIATSIYYAPAAVPGRPGNQAANKLASWLRYPGCSRSMCPVRQAGPHKEQRSGQRGDRFQVFSERRAHRPPS